MSNQMSCAGLWVLTVPLIAFFLQQNVDLRIPWQMKHFAYISCCRLACFIMKHFWPGVPVVVMMDLTLKSQYRVFKIKSFRIRSPTNLLFFIIYILG
jgi:hypothetical protein